MLRFLADQNLHGDILRGLIRQEPALYLLRIQDTAIDGADDPAVLEWAAKDGLVVLTHDHSTMAYFAYERVGLLLPMPGVIEISNRLPIGRAIEDVLIVAVCCPPEEIENRVIYVPLQSR